MQTRLLIVATIAVAVSFGTTEASVASRTVREAVEFAARKFGKEVAEEGVEKLSAKMASLASKHGDEVVSAAFRKVGPKASKLVGEAGEHAGVALRVLAKHGDDGVSLVARPSALKLIGRFGDDGAEALVRHGGVGEDVIGEFAERGVKALTQINPQNGRRLAMLANEGLAKPELVDLICRYGDRACEFIWKNKGALAVGATLATFLASPETYIEGGKELTSILAEAAVKPVVEAAALSFPWGLLAIAISALLAVAIAIWAAPRFLVQSSVRTKAEMANPLNPKPKQQ